MGEADEADEDRDDGDDDDDNGVSCFSMSLWVAVLDVLIFKLLLSLLVSRVDDSIALSL